jgi:hypothetical protein
VSNVNGKRPGGWVALAWRYFRDPRFDDVSGDAELLWVHALAYCGEQGTDGHVARGTLVTLSQRLVGSPQSAAGELVAAGLWEPTTRGWVVHAWDRWQPTIEQVAAGRARHAERMAQWRGRDRTTDGVTGPSLTPSRDVSRDVSRDGASVGGGEEGEGEWEGHSPTSHSPFTRGRENLEDIEPQPTRIGWEEYTDAAGNLFVRHATNGQAAELEP